MKTENVIASEAKQSMRIDCFVVAALLLAMTHSVYAADQSLFEQANSKYQAGDFKAAAAIYQKVVQTGQNTAAVYYDLGNATVKAGDKGQALVYYERALKAAPRDKDLLWNIHVLKGALKDKIEDDSFFVWAALREWLAQWTADEIALALSFFLAVAALWALVGLFLPPVRGRFSWIRTLSVSGIVLFGAVLAWKVWETKDPVAIVLDKETYAYYGPSDRETKAFLLHEGAQGKVQDISGDWIYLSLPNKKSGWIRKNSSEIV